MTPFDFSRCCSDIKKIKKEKEFLKAAKKILDTRTRARRVLSDGTCDQGPKRIINNDIDNNGKQTLRQTDSNNNIRITTQGIRYNHASSQQRLLMDILFFQKKLIYRNYIQ